MILTAIKGVLLIFLFGAIIGFVVDKWNSKEPNPTNTTNH